MKRDSFLAVTTDIKPETGTSALAMLAAWLEAQTVPLALSAGFRGGKKYVFTSSGGPVSPAGRKRCSSCETKNAHNRRK